MTIKIITDSTCDIPLPETRQMGIEMVPLSVNFGDETFVDKFTITNKEFYKKLQTSAVMPTTTLANPQQFIEVFNRYHNDDIIGIFLSAKLSGTFQSAVIAKETVKRNNIYLIDSNTTTIGMALLIEQALKYQNEGKTTQEIIQKINELIPKVEIYAIFDTLKYLVKGGRISASKGLIGNVLGVKPIIHLQNGELTSIGKERGMKKAITFVFNQINSKSEPDYNMPIAFAHSDNHEYLVNLAKNFPKENSKSYNIGSVVGTHAGPKAIAIAFFNK
ncbi:MAG: DegV family protein [Clostridia bacterium]|nr:DegV family protein [Clostridia bacterium]